VISVGTEKIGDGPAAVVPTSHSSEGSALTKKPLSFDKLRMGRRVKVGRVRKPVWIFFTKWSSRIRL